MAKRTHHSKDDKEPSDIPLREADEIISDVQDLDLTTADFTEITNLPEDLVVDTPDLSGTAIEKNQSTDVVRYDPLQSYLAEIKNIPLLTREQENELAQRYKIHGDKQAALKLVVSNLRLVVMIAREHQRNVQNILDLVQEGNIGLLEAVEKYDPTRGIRFPSYAVYWIRAYILRYLINNIRLVKVGTTQSQRKLFFNLVKEKERLEREGFAPEAQLLAKRLGVKESEVIEMEQRLGLPDLSVDAQISRNDGEGSDLHSILPDKSENQETAVANSEFKQAIRGVVDRYKLNADEKEIAIIEQRLLTDEPITLQEIADQFGISRERIRQIETRLKTRLKNLLEHDLDLNSAGMVDIADEVKS